MPIFNGTHRRTGRLLVAAVVLVGLSLGATSCGVARGVGKVIGGTVGLCWDVTKGCATLLCGTGKVAFKVGKAVMAPLTWPMTHEEIQTIDGLPPKEAIRLGRVKMAPYVVRGRRYVPMNTDTAATYREVGTASWYGYETYHQAGGRMTANGEAFDPRCLSAAHKHLPLPWMVKVTNLENNRSVVLRVNDRGPFVEGRILDVSAAAARRLGFFHKGTARVLVESVAE